MAMPFSTLGSQSQKAFSYERHRQEETLLYKVVQENLETFLAQMELEGGLPDFVKKEF